MFLTDDDIVARRPQGTAIPTQDDTDERYSRQIHTFGSRAMGRIRGGVAVIAGMDATGCEIAKNLVLSGVGHIALIVPDDLVVTAAIAAGNTMICVDSDMGARWGPLLIRKLQDLNRHTSLTIHPSLGALVRSATCRSGAFGGATDDPRRHIADVVVLCNGADCHEASISSSAAPMMTTDATWATLVEAYGGAARVAPRIIAVSTAGPFGSVAHAVGAASVVRVEEPSDIVEDKIFVKAVSLVRGTGGRPAWELSVDYAPNTNFFSPGDGVVLCEERPPWARNGEVAESRPSWAAVVTEANIARRTIHIDFREGDFPGDGLGTSSASACEDGEGASSSLANDRVLSASQRWIDGVKARGSSLYVWMRSIPAALAMLPMWHAATQPDRLMVNYSKPAECSHVVHFALRMFNANHRRRPVVADFREMASLCQYVADRCGLAVPWQDQGGEALLRMVCRVASVQDAATASVLGGVAAQEVLKALSGKYMPIFQFWYWDARELVLNNVGDDDDKKLCDSLLTEAIVRRLASAHIFLVGAGAIGCEYLKLWSAYGVGTSPRGRVTLTDDDRIEKSNLSRQLLFRECHIGQPKSAVAAAAVRERFQPGMKIRALEWRLDSKSCHPLLGAFGDRFWKSVDVVCTAVDNVKARVLLDAMSARHEIPLIDTGTQGCLGHCEACLPRVTPRLSDHVGQGDSSSAAIPFCTVHFFPTNMAHCVQFALELFAAHVTRPVDDALRMARAAVNHVRSGHGSNGVGDSGVDLVEAITDTLRAAASTFDEADRLQSLNAFRAFLSHAVPSPTDGATRFVRKGRDVFQAAFVDPLVALLSKHPPEAVADDGTPFWSDNRKRPVVPVFGQTSFHTEFVASFAVTCAHAYARDRGEEDSSGPSSAALAGQLERLHRSLAVDNAEMAAEAVACAPGAVMRESEEQVIHDACRHLVRLALPPASRATRNDVWTRIEARAAATIATFDKDNVLHIAFLSSAANIRAASFGIPSELPLAVLRLAGRIVPALVTTTAIVAGLGTIELIKLFLFPSQNADSASSVAQITPRCRVAQGVEQFPPTSLVTCTNVSLGDLRLTQCFEACAPRSVYVGWRDRTTGRSVALEPAGQFTTWDKVVYRAPRDVTIEAAIRFYEASLGGVVRVRDLIESVTSAWIYSLPQRCATSLPSADQDATRRGEEANTAVNDLFPLELWTRRWLAAKVDACDPAAPSEGGGASQPLNMSFAEFLVSADRINRGVSFGSGDESLEHLPTFRVEFL